MIMENGLKVELNLYFRLFLRGVYFDTSNNCIVPKYIMMWQFFISLFIYVIIQSTYLWY